MSQLQIAQLAEDHFGAYCPAGSEASDMAREMLRLLGIEAADRRVGRLMLVLDGAGELRATVDLGPESPGVEPRAATIAQTSVSD